MIRVLLGPGMAYRMLSTSCQGSDVSAGMQDAARQLKFIIQQEVKTGCQNKPGFSTKLVWRTGHCCMRLYLQNASMIVCSNMCNTCTSLQGELVGASDIQLSEVSLQTLEQYPHCNLHDRQVVLRALLQQRLSAVLACPPDEQVADVKEDGISDGVSDGECETALRPVSYTHLTLPTILLV